MDSPLHLQRMTKRKDLKWETTFSGVQEHYMFSRLQFYHNAVVECIEVDQSMGKQFSFNLHSYHFSLISNMR